MMHHRNPHALQSTPGGWREAAPLPWNLSGVLWHRYRCACRARFRTMDAYLAHWYKQNARERDAEL